MEIQRLDCLPAILRPETNQTDSSRVSTSVSPDDALARTIRRRLARGPRYVKAYEDRHGRRRYYYRRKGYPGIRLSGEPGTEAFQASYDAAETTLLTADAKRERTGGFVYAIRVRGFDLVKIGYSTSPLRRFVQLEAGSGMVGGLDLLMRVPGTRRLERRLHERFSSQRLFGEWFQLSGPVFEWLALGLANDPQPQPGAV